MPLHREEKTGLNSGIWLLGKMRGTKKPTCFHQPLTFPSSSKEIYAQPCFVCHTLCNCNTSIKYPDVLVRTVDFKTVRLGGYVVCGSWTLQAALRQKRLLKNKEAKIETSKMSAVTEADKNKIESTGNEKEQLKKLNGMNGICKVNCNGIVKNLEGLRMNGNSDKTSDECSSNDDEDTVPLSEIFEWTDEEVVDLRNEDGSPNLSVTSEILDICQRFLALHLDDVDETVAAEMRAVRFFDSDSYIRPTPGPVKYFAYEDWEEDLFNVDSGVFFELWQAAQRELRIQDMMFALDKWLALFRGRPADDTFGRALYNIAPVDPDERLLFGRFVAYGWVPDVVDTIEEYKDFYNRSWRNMRMQGSHNLPQLFRTVYYEHHKFPRRYQWKRGAAAGYDQEPGHVNYYLKDASGNWVPLAKFPIVHRSDKTKKLFS